MELAAIFLLLIVLILIVFFVSLPLFNRQRIRIIKNNKDLFSLQAEHERLLTALQELEFDHSLGKIPAEEYPEQRSELLHKGAEVLRELDALSSTTTKEIKKKVRRSEDKPTPLAALSEDELEDLIAKRRTIHKEKTGGFCPQCGKPVLQSDAFCPACGNLLKR
jgi:rubrerythrin